MNTNTKKQMNTFYFSKNILLLIASVFFSISAYGAEQPTAPVSYSSNLVQMMLGLMATVAMIFVVVWLIKRVGYNGYGTNSTMQIKSALSLSPKEKLLLVEVEGEKILIGVAPGFVGHVKTLDSTSSVQSSETNDEIQPQVHSHFSRNKVVNDLSSSFAEKLKAVLNKPEAKKEEIIG